MPKINFQKSLNIAGYGPKILVVIILLSLFVSSGSAALPNEPDSGNDENVETQYPTVFGAEETPIYINEVLTSGLTKLTNSKTQWVRGPEVIWSEIEAIENSYDWTKLDPALAELDEIINLGYTPIVIVRGTPTWAQIPNSSSCGPIHSSRFDDFGDFIQDVMQKFVDEELNVQIWEIWNEPDIDPSLVPADSQFGGCWGDENDDFYGGKYYSKMLSVAYQMIKSKNPNVQVLVGGLNLWCDPIDPVDDCDPKPAKFFEGILSDGAGNNFDGVSFHAYDGYGGEYGTYGNIWWKSRYDSTGPVLVAKSRYLRALLGAYGVGGKYLMSTETALICDPCDDDSAFEATKANYLADAYASSVASGLAANIWFDILGTWDRNNGLVNKDDLTNLPALDAYTFGSQMLEGAQFVRTVTEFEGVYGFEFKTPNPNYHVWVIRSIDGQNYTVQFTFPPVAVYDVYGDDISDDLTSDNELDVSIEPVYIVMPASVPRMALPYVQNYFKNLGNGDFEEGTLSWDFKNFGLPSVLIEENPTYPGTGQEDTSIPIGDYSAQLGQFGYSCDKFGVPVGAAVIEQQLYVADLPSTSVELQFKYVIYTLDQNPDLPLDPSDYDRFEVHVLSASGDELGFSDMNNNSPISCTNWRRLPSNSGWKTGTVDLDDYRGESILISFQNYNRPDGWYNTISFLDEVELVYSP